MYVRRRRKYYAPGVAAAMDLQDEVDKQEEEAHGAHGNEVPPQHLKREGVDIFVDIEAGVYVGIELVLGELDEGIAQTKLGEDEEGILYLLMGLVDGLYVWGGGEQG